MVNGREKIVRGEKFYGVTTTNPAEAASGAEPSSEG